MGHGSHGSWITITLVMGQELNGSLGSCVTLSDPFPALTWAHPSRHPKRHLDRLSGFSGPTIVTDQQADRQTNRRTNHASRSVTTGRVYVRSTAMRPDYSYIAP